VVFNTWPPVQFGTQAPLQHVWLAPQQVVPQTAVAHSQTHVLALSTWPDGQLVTQALVPEQKVCPAGHAQVQVVWFNTSPPVQLVTQVPVPVHNVVPVGHAQVQVDWFSTCPPVHAVTHEAVPLQNCFPAGHTHWHLEFRFSPFRHAGTQLVTPVVEFVHSVAPVPQLQVQVCAFSVWPLAQLFTQFPLHSVVPLWQPQTHCGEGYPV
jgi:hypothetical protein